MSKIEIVKSDITKLGKDAIVNAANSGLQAGNGVCGAIFRAAGQEQLQAACDRIGHCDVGSAVITLGFDLKAKYIIHAVGPKWVDGQHGEPELLKGAYTKSLELALQYGCASIAFPLISAGIFGYPVDRAWCDAIDACRYFLNEHPEHQMTVVFAVLDDEIMRLGQEALNRKPPARDKLNMAGRLVNAVFFHKPYEPNGFLSNWYPSPIRVDGMQFSSVEQYIMYKKCVLFGEPEAANAILATDDTKEQQAIGKTTNIYIAEVWAGMRQLVVMRGLYAKFSQNEDLKRMLLDTGDAWLVECAKSDKVWACGRRLDDVRRFNAAEWNGQNILGFALMEVREMLRGRKPGVW